MQTSQSPICKVCTDRPDGCWKAVNYHCATKYLAAGQRAMDRMECPLDKLTINPHRRRIFLFHTPRFDDRLAVCKDTWIADAVRDHLPVDIVLASDYGIADTNTNLPLLMQAYLRAVLLQDDWDYLFKCDNDTYICIPRWLKYDPKGRDYIGRNCARPPYAHGGGGYWISRKFATLLAEKLRLRPYYKDRQVGEIARDSGIAFTNDLRFVGDGYREALPSLTNNKITTHRVPMQRFCELWRELGKDAPAPPPETHEGRIARIRRERMVLLKRKGLLV